MKDYEPLDALFDLNLNAYGAPKLHRLVVNGEPAGVCLGGDESGAERSVDMAFRELVKGGLDVQAHEIR